MHTHRTAGTSLYQMLLRLVVAGLAAGLTLAPLVAQAQLTRPADYRQAWRMADQADGLRAAGRLREALPLLEQALQYNEPASTIRLSLAATLIDLGEPQRARPHLDSVVSDITQMITRDSRYAWAEASKVERGRAYALMGDTVRAEADFTAARTFLETAQRTAAAKDQTQLASLNEWVWAHNRLADLLEHTGQAPAARQQRQLAVQAFARGLEAVRMKDEERIGAWSMLADMHRRLGDVARSREARLREVELLQGELDGRPTRNWVRRDGVLFDLGWAHLDLGDEARARDYLRQAMQAPRDPDRPGAQDAAAVALLELDRDLARQLAAGGQPAQTHFRQGFELLRAGRTEEAGVRFMAGLTVQPGDALGTFYLAESLLARDPDEAMQHYRLALERGPGAEQAARARRALLDWHLRVANELTASPPRWGQDSVYVERLARLAVLQARAGDAARASVSFQRALGMVDKLANQHVRHADAALVAIAWRQLAAAGAAGDAGVAATLARIQSPLARIEARGSMIRVAHARGGPQAAASHIAQAIDDVGREPSPLIRVRALRVLGQAMWQIGDRAGVERLLVAMREAVAANSGRSDDARDRLDALYRALTSEEDSAAFDRSSYANAELAMLLLTMGDAGRADNALANVSSRSAAGVATHLAKAGHPAAADALHARRHPDVDAYTIRELRKDIAVAYARSGNFTQAWNRAGDIPPNDPRAELMRGDMGTRVDAYIEIASLQAVQDLDTARRELARRMTAMGDTKGGVTFDERLRSARALALARQGETVQALQAWPDRAMRPGSVDLHIALAYAWLGLKED